MEDLEEPPVLSFQTRSAGFGLPGHGDRGWKLSTAASDAERERVFHQSTSCTMPYIAYKRVSPQIRKGV